MSSVDPDGKEAVRRRESGERRSRLERRGEPRASRSTKAALKPKAKEQEVLDVATEYFLQHGYQRREHQRDGAQLRYLEGIDLPLLQQQAAASRP